MIRRSGAATAALFSRFVAYLVIVACIGALPSGGAAAQERLKVVATTTDLRSLVEEVGGSRVEAISLVPSAVDAEEYQPKPQDIARLQDARLLVRVGLDFDLWVDKLLTTAGNARLMRGAEGYVDASAAIAVLDVRGVSLGAPAGHAHGSGNPHYWLDPKNAEVITGHILEGLARVDPEHAKIYEANRLVFLNRLDAKLREWDARIAPVRGTPVVAYHNTWAYFARRFRIDFVGFIEQKPGVPAGTAHLAALLQMMRERRVRLIVRQPLEPQRDAAFLAQRTDAKVVVLAASVGALPATGDYFSLFDTNVAALVAAVSP